MLRLMGLPARTRCPRATVRRSQAGIELRFLGPDCDEGLALAGKGSEAEWFRSRRAIERGRNDR